MFESIKNIGDVHNNGLCTMCSTCAGICPQRAITMHYSPEKGTYYPVIDTSRCIDCGICISCCPGLEMNWAHIRVASQADIPLDPIVGRYIAAYRAYSNDSFIRKNGASGGMVTSILSYLLHMRVISAALVTRMNPDNPLEVLPYLAYDQDGLLNSQKSKYCPVPMNSILKSFIKDPPPNAPARIAFVGLPCHVAGLRMAQKHFPQLMERFPLVLSLFCHHMPNRRATEYLMFKRHVSVSHLLEVLYRDGRQLGNLKFLVDDGNPVCVPHLHWTYWGYAFLKYFCPPRCCLCDDKTGALADISFGDNWQKRVIDSLGTSTIIVRSVRGQNIVAEMNLRNWVTLETMQLSEVFKDQDLARTHSILEFKLKIWQLLGRKVPKYNGNIQTSTASVPKTLAAIQEYVRLLLEERNLPFPLLDRIIWCSWRASLLFSTVMRAMRKVLRVFSSSISSL